MQDIFIGLAENKERQVLKPGKANRHGLIAGATGTGKTVTLQTIAEQFSAAGVPVFLADVKGDLSGICMPGSHDFKHADVIEGRAKELGIDPRVQHALRAFTPRDQKAIKAAAETFRINPDLDDEGAPGIVQRTLIAPPHSRLGPVADKERAIIQSISPFSGKYDRPVNRESASEVLAQKAQDAAAAAQVVDQQGVEAQRAQARQTPSMWEKAGKAAMGAAAASAGTMLAHSLTGSASRSSPAARTAGAIAGSLATSIGGAALGRFARALLGGLLR